MSETMGRCRSEMNAAYERTRFRFKPNDSDEVIADAIDRLAADVAAIKAKTSDIEWEAVQHFVESEKAWVKLVEEQRDAAIRERDQWREEARLAVINRDEARAEVERLTARLGDRSEVQQTQLSAAFTEGTLQAGDAMRARFEQVEKERDEARAEVERLRAELAAPQPAAPATGWLTERERHVLSSMLSERPVDSSLHWRDDVQPVFRSILSRAGSPPSQTAAGWLTEEERELLALVNGMADDYSWDPRSTWRCNWPYSRVSLVVKALLSRAGSPPVVEVPALGFLGDMTGREQGIVLAYRDALDAAGVPWKEKEVPRE